MTKKYICYSRWVRGRDKEEHFISAHRLPYLYQVNPNECIFISREEDLRRLSKRDDLIVLIPRSDGNYKI